MRQQTKIKEELKDTTHSQPVNTTGLAEAILESHQTTDLEVLRLEHSDNVVKDILFTKAYDYILISIRSQLRRSAGLTYDERGDFELDAMSKVWEYLQGKSLDEYRDVGHAICSLMVRGKGAVKDAIRSLARKGHLITYTDLKESEGVNATSAEDTLAATQLLETLQRLELSDKERFVLNEVLLNGLPQVEAAAILGVQPPAVSKIVKRVRKKAAEALLEGGWDLTFLVGKDSRSRVVL